MQEQIITISGKNYKRAPEFPNLGCNGCSFWNSDAECVAVNNHDKDCYDEQSIWIPDDSTDTSKPSTEQKFTMQEFFDMLVLADLYLPAEAMHKLEALTDPEYKQYLELKKKFG